MTMKYKMSVVWRWPRPEEKQHHSLSAYDDSLAVLKYTQSRTVTFPPSEQADNTQDSIERKEQRPQR
jgi:hypothetical protein